MDVTDRTKLSALEIARREWVRTYKSMLYCPGRDTICSWMYGAWITGCKRKPCIKDDPEDQALQKRIEKNREAAEAAAREERKKEREAAPIRNQSKRIKTYEQKEMDEIHRLEQRSRQAFYNNNPQLGEELFTKAQFRRGELRKYIERKGERV